MNSYKYKVVYQWFNRVNRKPMTVTAFMTQSDLARLLVQPDIRLIFASSNLEQSCKAKSSKPIEK